MAKFAFWDKKDLSEFSDDLMIGLTFFLNT